MCRVRVVLMLELPTPKSRHGAQSLLYLLGSYRVQYTRGTYATRHTGSRGVASCILHHDCLFIPQRRDSAELYNYTVLGSPAHGHGGGEAHVGLHCEGRTLGRRPGR